MNEALKNILKKIERLPDYVNHLSVWDIDDTLFVSPKTSVYVVKGNEIIKKLSTEEFNGYRLRSGEKFDFFEFKDADLFFRTARPLSANLKRAKQALESKNTMVVILTARSDFNNKEKFLRKFEMCGLDMNRQNIHVIRSGNLGMSTVDGKKESLQSMFNTKKFRSAEMFDDDARNLNAFLSLKSKEISLKAYIVKQGKIMEY